MSSCLLGKNLSIIRSRILSITRPNIPHFHTLTKTQNTVCSINRAPLNFAPKRNYFLIFRKRTKREITLVDQPPEQYVLMYRSGIDHYFLSFQHLSFYAMVFICGTLLWNGFDLDRENQKTNQKPGSQKVAEDDDEEEEDKLENIIRLGKKYDEGVYLLAAFIFMYSLLHFFISRVPARIYGNPQTQKYLVYYYGMLPNQLKTLELKAGDLVPPKQEHVENMVPFVDNLYVDKQSGRHFLLIDEYFRKPADLYVLLGLQKDPEANFEFMDEEEPKVKSKK